MQKRLPPLDLIRGFEAAARHLSFTKAAAELHLTQSAISRQVQALEQHLGRPLFQRQHRALLLTDAGQILYRTAASLLADLAETLEQIGERSAHQLVTVTTTVSFASLWLVPRLPSFRQAHPGIDVRISPDSSVVDLSRSRVDLGIRYISPERVPEGAARLFGEEVLPVCSPALLKDPAKPLREPADLRHHVMLHFDDAPPRLAFWSWDNWLEAMDVPDLQPAGVLRFSYYDHLIQAAITGLGVGLGRLPLVASQLASGQLVAPFESRRLGKRPRSTRSYYVVLEPAAALRQEVRDFAAWLQKEAAGKGG